MEDSIKALERSVLPSMLGESLGQKEIDMYNEVVHGASFMQTKVYPSEIVLPDSDVLETNTQRLIPANLPLFDTELVAPTCRNSLCDDGSDSVGDFNENGFSAYHSFKKKFFPSNVWCTYCG